MKRRKMNKAIDRELLTKYMRGQCTATEEELVKAFLNQPGWKEALAEILKEDFETFEHTAYSNEENAGYNQRFRAMYTGHRPSRRLFSAGGSWIGYAAACLLLIGVSCWYFYARLQPGIRQDVAMLERINPKGQRSVITLPDSSKVYLGAASAIRYPEKFGSGNRGIMLKGEAYFEVAHDKRHPFTIQTGAIQTKVLGTTFKINAFKDVIVSVTTGKVQVAKLDSKDKTSKPLAILMPGQQVTWQHETGKTILAAINTDEIREWKDGKVTFANASLAEIAETLERWYNVDILLSDKKAEQIKLSMILKATVR